MKAKETKKTKKTTAKKPTTTKKAVKKPVVKAKKTPKTKKAVKTTAKTPKKTAVKRSEPKKATKNVVKNTPKRATKTTAQPSKKVQRANELRVESKKNMQKWERIQKNWEKELSGAKTSKERKAIDKKYSEKYNAMHKIEKATYEKYYNYVNNNFGYERVNKAIRKTKNFMSKRFINALGGNK